MGEFSRIRKNDMKIDTENVRTSGARTAQVVAFQ